MHINLRSLKKEARIRSRQNKSLRLSEVLDALSVERYKVRDYHQLLKSYEKQLNSHIKEKHDDLSWCEFCDFQFVRTIEADIQEHSERHSLFDDAFELFGYLPMQYSKLSLIHI